MIPGYVRESKCVKLCSLSFSLFKKIKFKMAKILGDAMGTYTDFAHFSGFQLEKRLNLGGGEKGGSRRRVLCKEANGKSLLVLQHLIWHQ